MLVTERPYFMIVGCRRSGTTLLKSILSAHSSIHVCQETFFFHSVAPRLHALSETPEKVANLWWLADAGLTPDMLQPLIRTRLGEGKELTCAVFSAILDFHAKSFPDSIIGEKSASHVNHLDVITKCLPNVKIIQIVRDPRAVLASSRKVNIGSNSLYDLVDEWKSSVQVLDKWAGRTCFRTLLYEDLVINTEDTLRGICDFLDVNWESGMLDFHSRKEDGYAKEQTHHINTRKPLFTDSIESWKTDLPSGDIALIDAVLGRRMKRFGYKTAGLQISNIAFRMACSRIVGQLHRFLVRVPRQRLKAFKAKSRLRAKRSSGF